MTANEIRKKFLDFFASKGHTVVESDTLVPKEDPTVLFTTAGMQQFKRQFLGQNVTYTRAASSQKCLRTDDLDKVGKTPYHHTFFEMLGNFSFGDYFKKDAIEWAWEFLTKTIGLPEEKLWVSVYEEDDEAEDIWLNRIKVPKKRFIKLDDKSNFWPAEAKSKGPNGPCGPCSEIFYDYGQKVGCGKKDCSPACDCGRFSEVWNLVFTQFNRKEGGILEPLPSKNIDTGMGLERLVAVINNKKSNYETDLFGPIIKAVKDNITSVGRSKNIEVDTNILADHIRAICFAISDGVIPSNEKSGYVVRRLIIESMDIAARCGHTKPAIYKLVDSVIDSMGKNYSEIVGKADEIKSTIKRTEESVIKQRKEKIPMIEPQIKANKDNPEELGKIITFSYGTHGIPVATILDKAATFGTSPHNQQLALKFHNKEMEKEKNRSRAASKMTGDVFTDTDLNLDVKKTVFRGCDKHEAKSKIIKMFSGNREIKEVKKGDEVKIVLDKTPFYAEAGGQIGDTGMIIKKNAKIKIADTQRIADIFIHIGSVEEGSFKLSDSVEAKINTTRRFAIMRNHTATHLLQAALRSVLGRHVKQQGSLVTDERLRFDFTHPKAVTKPELEKIEKLVNDYILSCDDVERETVSMDEARKKGALAFFAEKYGEKVSIVSVGEYSKELCGGTHLETVGQIGLFKIISESAIAQGIRRIEAKTGSGALEYIKERGKKLADIARVLKAPSDEVLERVQNQTRKIKELEKALGQLRFEAIKNSLDDIVNKASEVDKVKIVHHVFSETPIETLRKIADTIKQKAKSSVIALGSQNDTGAFIVVAATDDVIKKGIKANEMISEIAPLIQGSGGGRPQFAQAGSKDASNLKNALEKVEKIVKEKLSS